MPVDKPQPITYFAKTFFRSPERLFGIKQKDRFTHTYIIGQTGTGKSNLLKTMLVQDILNDRGICLIEPHGDLIREVISLIPKRRKDDLVFLDATDPNCQIGYNPFRKVSFEKRALVASGILDVLRKLWHDAWGNKLEHILRHIILALLDQPKATFADMHNIMFDHTYRENAISRIESPSVRRFFEQEYPKYTRFDLMPIMNKIGAFLAYPVVKRILVENADRISLRSIMDEGKILIVNVSKGHIGSDATSILGGLLLTSLTSAAHSRVAIAERNRRPFHVYLDEFHTFASLSIINILSELRKFRISLTMSHQYMNQLDTPLRQSIIGNVGTKICFRLGYDDARIMVKDMTPEFELEDLLKLPNYFIYLSLMIDGSPSRPFSAKTVRYRDLPRQRDYG